MLPLAWHIDHAQGLLYLVTDPYLNQEHLVQMIVRLGDSTAEIVGDGCKQIGALQERQAVETICDLAFAFYLANVIV
jgi:hypothetical protein